MPAPVWYALSVKQPWAALLVAGIKAVEVRTWDTRRRGPVLIHAARNPDPRPDGWAHVTTPAVRRLAETTGGIIGVAELVDCVTYPTPSAFAAAAPRHLNPPAWFAPPRLFGFAFAHPRPLPFRPLPGKTFFFPVPGVIITAPETSES
ncbi:MAG: ASCH domain-containing protein [Gemmataceae bacterium]